MHFQHHLSRMNFCPLLQSKFDILRKVFVRRPPKWSKYLLLLGSLILESSPKMIRMLFYWKSIFVQFSFIPGLPNSDHLFEWYLLQYPVMFLHLYSSFLHNLYHQSLNLMIKHRSFQTPSRENAICIFFLPKFHPTDICNSIFTSLATHGSETQENVISTLSTTSQGVGIISAPASWNLWHFSSVRFQTTTLCPEFNKFFTMPPPMIPNPRNPNRSGDGLIFFDFNVSETACMLISGKSYEQQNSDDIHKTYKTWNMNCLYKLTGRCTSTWGRFNSWLTASFRRGVVEKLRSWSPS